MEVGAMGFVFSEKRIDQGWRELQVLIYYIPWAVLLQFPPKDNCYEAQTLQSECRVRVGHVSDTDTCPTRIGHSDDVSDFKQP